MRKLVEGWSFWQFGLVVTKRALVAVALAMTTMLAAGCTSSGSHGPYGPGAYRLLGHAPGYSAEVILKQINTGVVVLAAGGSYEGSRHLCATGLIFAFYENGKERMSWAPPRQYGCLISYDFGDHRVCLSASQALAATAARVDVIGGCRHPVFPLDTGIDTKLTAQDKAYGVFYTVKSAGILILPRSGARTEQ